MTEGKPGEMSVKSRGDVLRQYVPFVDSERPLTGVHDSSAALSALREEPEVQPNWCLETAKTGTVADRV